MPESSWMRAGAKNLALLLLAFLPVFLLLAGLLGRIGGHFTSDVLGDASVLYPGLLGPVFLGGLVYLGCLFAALGRVRANGRVLAVALTPLIAIGFAPFGVGHVLTISHFLIAFLISLVLYGLLVRLPRWPSEQRGDL